MPCSVRLADIALVALLFQASIAWGQPVHVSTRTSAGQGTGVVHGSECYVLTAAHVVGPLGSGAELVNLQAYVAQAKVVATDASLDVAILKVERAGQGSPKVCSTQNRPRYVAGQSLGKGGGSGNVSWIERIPTPAGGVERLGLISEPASRERPQFDSVVSGAASPNPQQGTSGAAIWFNERAGGARYLDAHQGKLRHLDGVMAGMHLGFRAGKYYAVRADLVFDVLARYAQPLSATPVGFRPEGLRVAHVWRGNPPTSESGARVRRFADAFSAHVTFDLDLGLKDNFVKGARVDHVAGPTPVRIEVWTSQAAPDPAGVGKWTREACTTRKEARFRGSTTCDFKAMRNARSVRVEVHGPPASIRALEVMLD